MPSHLAARSQPVVDDPPGEVVPSPPPSPTSVAQSPSSPVRSDAINLLIAQDKKGDAGIEAPSFADLVSLTVDSTGTDVNARVEVAGALPPSLAEDQLMFLGVDIYRPGQTESDYQLLVQGSEDGWFAYLETPEGFVQYPGSFQIGSNQMIFRVPWRSLGEMPAGSFSVFCDWSKKRILLNEASSDRLPDEGSVVFTR